MKTTQLKQATIIGYSIDKLKEILHDHEIAQGKDMPAAKDVYVMLDEWTDDATEFCELIVVYGEPVDE